MTGPYFAQANERGAIKRRFNGLNSLRPEKCAYVGCGKFIVIDKKGGEMKKIASLLVFIALTQFFWIFAAFGETINDHSETKALIDKYYAGIMKQDKQLIEECLSSNYSSRTEKGVDINFSNFVSVTRKNMEAALGKYTVYFPTEIEIAKSDIKDNKASLEVITKWEGLRSDNNMKENWKLGRLFSLVKENGSWKIISVQWIPLDAK